MKKVICLNRNESQYDLSPRCKELLTQLTPAFFTQYSSDETITYAHFIEELSHFLEVPASCIALGNGSEELLKACAYHFLEKNDVVLMPERSWWYYHEIITEVQARPAYFEIVEGSNSFHFDYDLFSHAYHEHSPQMVLLASPNNPTGHSMPLEILEKVFNLCKNSLVVVDEAYWGFNEFNLSQHHYFIKKYPNVIFVRTFSKYFGLAGVRLGYVLAGDNFFSLKKYLQRYLGYSPLTLALCSAALKDHAYFSQLNLSYQQTKEIFYQTLTANSGITSYLSDANFILLKPDPDLFLIIQEKMTEAGILLSYLQTPKLQNYIRFTLGRPEQNNLILKILTRCIDKKVPLYD